MGLMVDTNVFISFEKSGQPFLMPAGYQDQIPYVSVITISELLIGAHRANSEQRRQRRLDFIDLVLSGGFVVDFTLATARIHAEIHADLSVKGQLIGAHDLLIAATARYHNLSLLTDNVDEFSRVPGLQIISATK